MKIACRVIVRGVVQGVGFRPFVHATATELGLSGSVGNSALGVVIDVEGDGETIDAFVARVRNHPPTAGTGGVGRARGLAAGWS